MERARNIKELLTSDERYVYGGSLMLWYCFMMTLFCLVGIPLWSAWTVTGFAIWWTTNYLFGIWFFIWAGFRVLERFLPGFMHPNTPYVILTECIKRNVWGIYRYSHFCKKKNAVVIQFEPRRKLTFQDCCSGHIYVLEPCGGLWEKPEVVRYDHPEGHTVLWDIVYEIQEPGFYLYELREVNNKKAHARHSSLSKLLEYEK